VWAIQMAEERVIRISGLERPKKSSLRSHRPRECNMRFFSMLYKVATFPSSVLLTLKHLSTMFRIVGLVSWISLVFAKTVTYDFSIGWVTVSRASHGKSNRHLANVIKAAPDGYTRPVIGVNGQWPCVSTSSVIIQNWSEKSQYTNHRSGRGRHCRGYCSQQFGQ
jgi:hypothetical protein